MSTKKKLIKRFKSLPCDFTFEETIRLLGCFGYKLSNKGPTSGSRVEFSNGKNKITLHKPHPNNTICRAVMLMINKQLKDLKLI